jgi:hypothetical protein
MNAVPKATNVVTAIFFILAGLEFFGIKFPFIDQLTGAFGMLGGIGNVLNIFTGNKKK